MFVHDLVGSEQHPVYQEFAAENLSRQYSFLRSAVLASMGLHQPMLSIELIKALNYHAISCLHFDAGQFRPCKVTVGEYIPPQHFQVPSLMQTFTNQVNWMWDSTDAVVLAAFVLWRMNWIHPFINGNGRAARAACHFVLCTKAGGWLPGAPLLPELLRRDRVEYVAALKEADRTFAAGTLELGQLHDLLVRLLNEQLNGAEASSANDPQPE